MEANKDLSKKCWCFGPKTTRSHMVVMIVLYYVTDVLHLWNMGLRLKMVKRMFGMGEVSDLRDTEA